MAQGRGALERKKAKRKSFKSSEKARKAAEYASKSSNKGSSPTQKKKSGPQNEYGSAKTPSTKKLYRGGGDFPISKESYMNTKRSEAKLRNDAWASLSFEHQLSELNVRAGYLRTLGLNGCDKQISKIQKKMAEKPIKVEVKTSVVIEVPNRKLKAKERNKSDKNHKN
jgi:hypothetical protein